MWRTLFVAALLVLSGCATDAPGTEADADRSATHRALTSEETPDRPNPWGEGELTVAINNTANESREFRPLVSDALDFWASNSTRFVGFPLHYELVPNASNPDIVVEFVESIDSCANVDDPAGCAPYVTGEEVSRTVSIEVDGSYDDSSTLLILKHELGHIFGLNHSADPQSVMAPTSQLKTLPRPNATERRLPWTDANFTVYLDAARTDDPDETRKQVRRAFDYYADGADGAVPENVSFRTTENRSAADVVVEFTDDLPCRTGDSGSCGRVRGNDPDGDGALERYDHLRVTLSDIDTAAVGWHVGYWLGYGFGFEEDPEWPAPFRNATYDDRRGAWWK
jgi:hypothetical protein